LLLSYRQSKTGSSGTVIAGGGEFGKTEPPPAKSADSYTV
jgi:hypothetical protein